MSSDLSDEKYINLLVGLDELLDTRAAVLIQHDAQNFEQILRNGYHARVADEFEGITPEEFKALYMARDVHTLSQAMATPAVQLVKLFIEQTVKAAMTSPLVKRPRVVLNTYPYELPEKAIDGIVAGIAARLGGFADIMVKAYTYEDLTPYFVKTNFIEMLLYHPFDWLQNPAHEKAFEQTRVPHVSLIAPELFKSIEAAKTLGPANLVAAAESHYSPVVKLNFVPATYFSFDFKRFAKTQPA